MGEKAPAIGIDLGTTYCCVAFFQYPKVEIIPNDQGNRTTPSYVAFTDKERLIGDPAKDQMAENHANTVYNAKRLIGRRFNDESVQEDRRDFSFQVVNHVGKPKISVNYNGENKKYLPEQISAMILEKMKQVAEDYIGCEVKDAVITVPAYFNDAQRTATKTAGTIAGLNVIRIINEPTAAAIAFGLDQKTEGEKNVLIFDLGGGTFDVSILTIDDGIFKARATCGNTHLGGEDFDSRMVNHFVEEFQEVYDKDISEDKRALRRLRTACELAKRLLSSDNQASVQVPALFGGIDFKSTITRVKFEDLCIDLFESTLVPVEKALEDAKMKKSEIDEVILVGGSTRIPIIQKLLKEFFDGKELNKSIDPDEAVAYGAAVQAAILNGDKSDEIQDILLLDITPISLGMETEGGIMTNFFKRNSTIPRKETKYFSTTRDNQTSVMIQIYEGERALTKDNNYLGHFQLTGIPKAPRKEPQIEVTFEINANGILDVSAVEKSSGVQHKITIKPDKGRLNSDQIEQMVKDGEKGRTADEAVRKRIAAQNLLRGTALQFKATVNQEAFTRAGMSQESKDQVADKVKEVLKWINSNDNASFEDLDRKHKQLLAVCEPVLEQYKKKSAAFIGNSRPSPRADLAGISQGPSTSGNSSGNNNKNNNNNSNNPRTGPKISELN